MNQKKRYSITLAGNIGVGKTSLTKMLAEDLRWKPFFEPFAENPYLSDFYENMDEWALYCQLYFLANRLKFQREIEETKTSLIQDRGLYEDANIFAKNLYDNKSIDERGWSLYNALYREVKATMTQPDLVVYLKANVDTLLHRISLRARSMETEIPRDYLENLNKPYNDWIDNFTDAKVLTIEVDDIDFVKNSEDYRMVKEKILKAL